MKQEVNEKLLEEKCQYNDYCPLRDIVGKPFCSLHYSIGCETREKYDNGYVDSKPLKIRLGSERFREIYPDCDRVPDYNTMFMGGKEDEEAGA